jgi:hypothetical protein
MEQKFGHFCKIKLKKEQECIPKSVFFLQESCNLCIAENSRINKLGMALFKNGLE